MAVVDRFRDIRNSIRLRASTLLASPPAASGLTAYTVYGEVELRQVQSKTLTPVRPSVFVVDRAIRPVEMELPLVVVELRVATNPFELGTRAGREFDAWLHCFGRQRNESSMLASFFQDYLPPLAIYDFGDPDAPVLSETARLADRVAAEEYSVSRQDDLRQEGTLDHWMVVSLRGWTKN